MGHQRQLDRTVRFPSLFGASITFIALLVQCFNRPFGLMDRAFQLDRVSELLLELSLFYLVKLYEICYHGVHYVNYEPNSLLWLDFALFY